METDAKSKWQIRLAVLLIFLVGFTAGALAVNFYRTRQSEPPAAGTRGRFDQVIERLNLTPEQRDQVKAIFEDARVQLMEVRKESEPRFREVRKQTDERLKAVLTPDQWEQFQQLKSEFKQRRRFGRDRRDNG
jgi:Spy/CpxP family protein refolding chaperone